MKVTQLPSSKPAVENEWNLIPLSAYHFVSFTKKKFIWLILAKENSKIIQKFSTGKGCCTPRLYIYANLRQDKMNMNEE
jgi:hypothetical protein